MNGPSNALKLEAAYSLKNKELALILEICEAKASDKNGLWQRMLTARQSISKSNLRHLNPNDPNLKVHYARMQAVTDEYGILLGLLRDPDKRRQKVEVEIDKMKKDIKSMQNQEVRSPQY